MATNTTNFNLSKPAYTDTADIAVINSNMDKVDTSLQGLGTGLAIISKNNTHSAVSNGQYLYIHGHGSLTEGLYRAKSNIAANATLSTSNVSSVSDGLGNKLTKAFDLSKDNILIQSNDDLDNYNTTGTYICLSYAIASTLLHSPYSAGNFKLIVSANSGTDGSAIFGSQIILPGSENANYMYVRCGSSSGWGMWTRLGYNAQPSGYDIFYNIPISGYISSSSTEIKLLLNTPVRYDHINGITVTKFEGVIRGINGYVDNEASNSDWVGKTGITITAGQRNYSSILFTIKKSSAFANVTNNTPINAYLTDIRVSYT